MSTNTAMSTLLADACPSIRYRLRREVLGQSPRDPEMKPLQVLILRDPYDLTVRSWLILGYGRINSNRNFLRSLYFTI